MADITNENEHRRHPRHPINKAVKAKSGNRQGTGVTRDISASGAAIDFDMEVAENELLELDIEDVGYMASQVARPLDDGFAVRFVDLEDEDEENLLAELESLHASIDDDF